MEKGLWYYLLAMRQKREYCCLFKAYKLAMKRKVAALEAGNFRRVCPIYKPGEKFQRVRPYSLWPAHWKCLNSKFNPGNSFPVFLAECLKHPEQFKLFAQPAK